MDNSLEYYLQAAADSDDSDCDLLVQKPIFQSRKKAKQNEAASPSSIVSLSQSSLDSNASTMLTEEKIEAKAKEMIKDLKYPGLGDTNSVDQLGWHKHPIRKGAKEFTWYPCRLASHDERIGLFRRSRKGGGIPVRYLGYNSDTATKYGEIKSNQYIPLTAENKESGMETYIRHLEKHFKDDVFACRAEILAVHAMWSKVEERELDYVSKTKSPMKQTLRTTARVAESTARNTKLNKTQEEYSDSDLDSEDKGEHDTASRKRHLRAGDVIEYYDPIGVVGKPQWLKTAKIVGVDAKGNKFPLNLDNGDFLDRSTRVKRVKRLYRKKLETCYDDAFKGIVEYGLKSGGTMEMIGVKTKVEKVKRIRNKFDSEVHGFWGAVSPKLGENSVTNSNFPCHNFEDRTTRTGSISLNGVSITNEKNRQLSRPLALRNQNRCKEESNQKLPGMQG